MNILTTQDIMDAEKLVSDMEFNARYGRAMSLTNREMMLIVSYVRYLIQELRDEQQVVD